MFALYLIGIILILGLCVMLVSMRNAPRGFEDETGFHQAPETKPTEKTGTVAARKSVVTKPLAAANAR
jgi:hypothetical protein